MSDTEPKRRSDSSDDGVPNFLLWAKNLEHVLHDYEGLRLFQTWMARQHSTHSIHFYFAIVAFKKAVADLHQSDSEQAQLRTWLLVKQIYFKFLKRSEPKAVESCSDFLSVEAVDEISVVVKNFGEQNRTKRQEQIRLEAAPDGRLFDRCLDQVTGYLRGQHALFCSSDEYMTAINRLQAGDDFSDGSSLTSRSPSVTSQSLSTTTMEDPASTSILHPSSNTADSSPPPPLPPRIKKSLTTSKKSFKPKSNLTAKTLMSTQTMRDTALGRGSILFPSKPMWPYVPAPNTSKNDSAISSAFSSEASGGQHGVQTGGKISRKMKQDQRKLNQSTKTNTIPRNEFLKKSATVEQMDTVEKMQDFYLRVCEKLRSVEEKQKCDDHALRGMSDLAAGRRDPRAVVADVSKFEEKHKNFCDEDEDLEEYILKNRLKQDDSSKPSPGSQCSPGDPISFARRRSPTTLTSFPDLLKDHSLGFSARDTTSPEHRLPVPVFSFPAPYKGRGFAPPPVFSKGKHPSTGGGHHSQLSPKVSSLATNVKRCHDIRSGMAISDTSGIESNVSSMSIQSDQQRRLQNERSRQKIASNSQKRHKAQASTFNSLPHLMTIGYYVSKDNAVPYIKKIERAPITFRQFKQYFAVAGHKSENKQFYFKKQEEFSDAPFQWLLISDDDDILPVFEGKVMAEVKSIGDSD